MCALLSGMTSDHIFLDLFVSFLFLNARKRVPRHTLLALKALYGHILLPAFSLCFFFSQERALSASGSTKNVITLSKTGMKAP